MKKLKSIHPFKKLYKYIVFCGCLLLVGGCQKKIEPITKYGMYFDTVVEITLYNCTDPSLGDNLLQMADTYDHMLSATLPDSDIYKLNHAKGQRVAIQKDTYDVLNRALSYSILTDGKVDPTILPLSSLWDFSSESIEKADKTPPSLPKIEDALSHIGYDMLILEEKNECYYASLKDPAAQIDLGFIAKGFIADQMAAYCKPYIGKEASGILLSLGRNMYMLGDKGNNVPYKIGVQRPFGKDTSPIATLSVDSGSVVTSGIYERYFTYNDTLYHHILDGTTGYPVDTDLVSVTILSDSSTDGDALSTTCLILGLEEGMALIEQTKNVEALMITADEQLHYSSGFPIED